MISSFNDKVSANKGTPLQVKVLKNEELVVGFITYTLYKEVKRSYDLFKIFSPIRYGHIEAVGVDAEKRNKGFGTQLLTFAINDLKKQGVNVIDLSVHRDNPNAIACYKKLGFVQKSDDGYNLWLEKTCK